MGESPIRTHLYISGRVQGVNFRYYTMREAQSLGLVGWVRNLPDGRVEVLVEGEKKDVRTLVDWCRQGPPSAHVIRLEENREESTGGFFEFSVRSTPRFDR